MKKYSHIIILGVVLLLGVLLRFYKLGEVPFGFFKDEAALGYNAFSIFKTGRDEFGVHLPVVFRSFEVFFLPLYVYLSSVVVGLLGLSEFSTRFLTALSGVAGFISVYLITKEFWNRKIALFTVLILAISPWHIFYSRGSFEGNLALTLFSFGVFFWLKFTKTERLKHVFFSGLFFILSMYSYQAERVVVPLFGLMMFIFSFKKLMKIKIRLIPIIFVFLFLLTPLLSITFRAGGYHRVTGVSIFAKSEKPPGYIEGLKIGFFQNNRVYLRTRQVASLYLSYFSPKNLFVNGDFDKQRSVVNFSIFYFWLLPFLFIGLTDFVKKITHEKKVILTWVLLAPLPAALTGDPFHTYRSLLLYFPLTLIIGIGLGKVFVFLNSIQKKWFISIVSVLLFSFLACFLYSYFYLTQADRARSWDYGYKEIMSTIKTFPKESRIIFDDPWTEPYIHYLFFLQIDPAIYQKEVEKEGYPKDFYYSDISKLRPVKFDRVEFRRINWPKERGDKGTYFVIYAPNLPESEFATDPKVEVIKNISYSNGTAAFRILKIK